MAINVPTKTREYKTDISLLNQHDTSMTDKRKNKRRDKEKVFIVPKSERSVRQSEQLFA